MEEEPPFEIEEVRDEPGGIDFEIGESDEIAHVYSLKVDGLVRKLARQDGILEAVREDQELILVRAPSSERRRPRGVVGAAYQDQVDLRLDAQVPAGLKGPATVGTCCPMTFPLG